MVTVYGNTAGRMRPYVKYLLPVLVLGIAVLAARGILGSRPEPSFRPESKQSRSVEATRLEPTDYPVVIRSQGTVRPTVANTLVSEVIGTIARLADDFVAGGAFEQGDLLVQIDERDYAIALTRARASLAQAEAQFEEQSAQAEQARVEWQQLGRRGEPSALTLREPQLAAASAERDAAAAEVERAELDLERTRVHAPYAGRVLERAVDTGQFVNRGAVIGRIHAIDSVDVRLPLGARQQTFLRLPGALPAVPAPGEPFDAFPNVEIETRRGGKTLIWTGNLVRVEGVDEGTRQLNVIARIDDPWSDASAPLRVGEYVEARIAGQVLEDVFVIPRAALRESNEVLIVDAEGTLQRRTVVVAWSDEQVAAVTDGLENGTVLVLTPLSTVVDGTPVRAIIDGVQPPSAEEDDRQGNHGSSEDSSEGDT